MATPEAEDFAALLKELKGRSGLSYGVLAGRLHVSTSTLHRYCNGDAVPNDYAPVERLGRLCGAKPDELVELHRRWIVADAARRRPAPAAESVSASAPAAASASDSGTVSAAAPDPTSVPGPASGSASGPASGSASAPGTVPERDVPVVGGTASAERTDAGPAERGDQDGGSAGDDGSGMAATGSGAVTGTGTAARSRRFRSSPRMRVLLAAAAVVALTVPTTMVVSKLSGTGDSALSNAPMVDGVENDMSAPPAVEDRKGTTASPGTPSASATSGATRTPSLKPGGGSSGSASAGSGRGAGAGGTRTGGGPPVSATISSYNWAAPCGQYYVLDREPENVPPPPSPQDTRGWARALGGVDGGHMQLELVLQGKSGDAVVLRDLHVRQVARKAPLPWSAYSMGDGCGSGITPQTFDIDLDDARPVLRPVAGEKAGKPVPPKDFPFRVTSTDVEVFDLDVHVEAHDVSWYLELDWSSGGRKGTLRIDDGGEPFRTSAIETRPLYKYRYDTVQWATE
ncbi:helix-turn-helix domain-containing protein [Streptomyces sp. NPDC014744]|uniref:helix-turn-helix domain-containing protein n=1 Tax=Streptomyces sp. NPDC014744 TaxID=3364903 RepID=UPI00370290FF